VAKLVDHNHDADEHNERSRIYQKIMNHSKLLTSMLRMCGNSRGLRPTAREPLDALPGPMRAPQRWLRGATQP
jgi:hypothetical protein